MKLKHSIQDGIVSVYRKPIDAESVASRRVPKRQDCYRSAPGMTKHLASKDGVVDAYHS